MSVPMGFKAHFAVGEESSFGGAVAPTVFLPWRSVSLNGSNDFVQSTAARGGSGRRPPQIGVYQGEGSFQFECDSDNIGLLMRMALGGYTKTYTGVTEGTSAIYEHEFKLGTGKKSFTAETNLITEITSGKACQRIAGCMARSVGFSIDPKNILLCDIGAYFKGELADAGSAAVYSDKDPFYGGDMKYAGSVVIDGTNIPYLNNFRCNIEIPIDNSNFTLGSDRFVRSLDETGPAIVSGSFDLAFEDAQMLRTFYGNKTTADGPQDTYVSSAMHFLCQKAQIGSSAYYYALTFVLGKTYFKTAHVSQSSTDKTKQTVNFESYETTLGGADDISLKLINVTDTDY